MAAIGAALRTLPDLRIAGAPQPVRYCGLAPKPRRSVRTLPFPRFEQLAAMGR